MSDTVYGANISEWAGQTGQLEFTADFNGSYNYVVLDDITFSTQAVPEPNTVDLTCLAVAMVGLEAWRKSNKAAVS
jgi:hypothetical protein